MESLDNQRLKTKNKTSKEELDSEDLLIREGLGFSDDFEFESD